MKRKSRGRGGGRWGAPAAPLTQTMISGYRPATCPSATPFRRALRCSAGSAHSLYWGVSSVFLGPNPKFCLRAHACLFKHFKCRNKPVFGLAFRSKDGQILTPLPCGRVSFVGFQMHGKKMTPCIEIEYENISRWVPGAAVVFKDRKELQTLSCRNLIGCAGKPFQSPGIK